VAAEEAISEYRSMRPFLRVRLQVLLEPWIHLGHVDLLDREIEIEPAAFGERLGAAVRVRVGAAEHARHHPELRERVLLALHDIGDVRDDAVHLARLERIGGPDAGRAERDRAVVDLDRVELEREHLLQLGVPVLFTAELGLLAVGVLDQVQDRLVELRLRHERAVQQAVPLHREVDAVACEERRRLLRAALLDLDPVHAVGTAPQADVDVAHVAVIGIHRVQPPVDVVAHDVRQHQPDRSEPDGNRDEEPQDVPAAPDRRDGVAEAHGHQCSKPRAAALGCASASARTARSFVQSERAGARAPALRFLTR
jgi:hypothetical protein